MRRSRSRLTKKHPSKQHVERPRRCETITASPTHSRVARPNYELISGEYHLNIHYPVFSEYLHIHRALYVIHTPCFYVSYVEKRIVTGSRKRLTQLDWSKCYESAREDTLLHLLDVTQFSVSEEFVERVNVYMRRHYNTVFREVFCHQPNEKHDDIWAIMHEYLWCGVNGPMIDVTLGDIAWVRWSSNNWASGRTPEETLFSRRLAEIRRAVEESRKVDYGQYITQDPTVIIPPPVEAKARLISSCFGPRK